MSKNLLSSPFSMRIVKEIEGEGDWRPADGTAGDILQLNHFFVYVRQLSIYAGLFKSTSAILHEGANCHVFVDE